jgi:hypothetical protein
MVESTVHKKIGDKYKSVFINKVIYRFEYLKDGLSANGLKMRLKILMTARKIKESFYQVMLNLKLG